MRPGMLTFQEQTFSNWNAICSILIKTFVHDVNNHLTTIHCLCEDQKQGSQLFSLKETFNSISNAAKECNKNAKKLQSLFSCETEIKTIDLAQEMEALLPFIKILLPRKTFVECLLNMNELIMTKPLFTFKKEILEVFYILSDAILENSTLSISSKNDSCLGSPCLRIQGLAKKSSCIDKIAQLPLQTFSINFTLNKETTLYLSFSCN